MKSFLSFINIDFLVKKDSIQNWKMIVYLSLLALITIYSGHSTDRKVIKASDLKKEINIIKSLLVQSSRILKKGGRLVCISYHSLEDRLVKRFIQNGTFESDTISDIYGNKDLIFKKIGKLISPDKEEVGSNNRSRSAKLRVAEKI